MASRERLSLHGVLSERDPFQEPSASAPSRPVEPGPHHEPRDPADLGGGPVLLLAASTGSARPRLALRTPSRRPGPQRLEPARSHRWTLSNALCRGRGLVGGAAALETSSRPRAEPRRRVGNGARAPLPSAPSAARFGELCRVSRPGSPDRGRRRQALHPAAVARRSVRLGGARPGRRGVGRETEPGGARGRHDRRSELRSWRGARAPRPRRAARHLASQHLPSVGKTSCGQARARPGALRGLFCGGHRSALLGHRARWNVSLCRLHALAARRAPLPRQAAEAFRGGARRDVEGGETLRVRHSRCAPPVRQVHGALVPSHRTSRKNSKNQSVPRIRRSGMTDASHRSWTAWYDRFHKQYPVADNVFPRFQKERTHASVWGSLGCSPRARTPGLRGRGRWCSDRISLRLPLLPAGPYRAARVGDRAARRRASAPRSDKNRGVEAAERGSARRDGRYILTRAAPGSPAYGDTFGASLSSRLHAERPTGGPRSLREALALGQALPHRVEPHRHRRGRRSVLRLRLPAQVCRRARARPHRAPVDRGRGRRDRARRARLAHAPRPPRLRADAAGGRHRHPLLDCLRFLPFVRARALRDGLRAPLSIRRPVGSSGRYPGRSPARGAREHGRIPGARPHVDGRGEPRRALQLLHAAQRGHLCHRLVQELSPAQPAGLLVHVRHFGELGAPLLSPRILRLHRALPDPLLSTLRGHRRSLRSPTAAEAPRTRRRDPRLRRTAHRGRAPGCPRAGLRVRARVERDRGGCVLRRPRDRPLQASARRRARARRGVPRDGARLRDARRPFRLRESRHVRVLGPRRRRHRLGWGPARPPSRAALGERARDPRRRGVSRRPRLRGSPRRPERALRRGRPRRDRGRRHLAPPLPGRVAPRRFRAPAGAAVLRLGHPLVARLRPFRDRSPRRDGRRGSRLGAPLSHCDGGARALRRKAPSIRRAREARARSSPEPDLAARARLDPRSSVSGTGPLRVDRGSRDARLRPSRPARPAGAAPASLACGGPLARRGAGRLGGERARRAHRRDRHLGRAHVGPRSARPRARAPLRRLRPRPAAGRGLRALRDSRHRPSRRRPLSLDARHQRRWTVGSESPPLPPGSEPRGRHRSARPRFAPDLVGPGASLARASRRERRVHPLARRGERVRLDARRGGADRPLLRGDPVRAAGALRFRSRSNGGRGAVGPRRSGQHARGDPSREAPDLDRRCSPDGRRRAQALSRRSVAYGHRRAHRVLSRRRGTPARRRLRLPGASPDPAGRGSGAVKARARTLALVAAIAAPALGDEPKRDDFAYGVEMRPGGDAPLLRVRLPIGVYRKLTRTDLGDLRVFNARSELVPNELWRQADESQSETRTVELDVFPLEDATPAAVAAVKVRIERGAESASLQVTGEELPAPPGVAAYILDRGSREASPGVERLFFDWSAPEASFVERVRVETSDDLETWSRAGEGVLAELGHDGERVVRSDVPLEGPARRYLRVVPADGSFPVAFDRARLEHTSTTELAELAWEQVSPTQGDVPGELRFELPGPLFVEAIEILPETNSWTATSLFSRADPEGRWTRRASAPIYDFALGGERVASTRLETGGTRDRYWKVVPETSGGGFGVSVPGLRVGWRPDELVFVARGDAPFTLAYGSARVGKAPPTSASLRELASDGSQSIEPSDDVSLGDPFPLGGESALAPPRVSDWKRVVLWCALGLASIVLVLTARAALRGSAGLGGEGPPA